jgi:hypothetical protein
MHVLGRLIFGTLRDATLAELTRDREGGELEARLQERGIPCHTVQNSAAACADQEHA